MFDAYIASSPSLHWGDSIVFKEAETFFKKRTALTKKFLFYTVGGRDWAPMISNARDFEKQLKEKAPDGLEWHFQFLENDEHGTISHRSFCNGLETLYAGFLFSFEEPSMQSLEGIKTHYGRLSEKYGFTVPVPLMIASLVGYDLTKQGKLDEALKVLTFNAENYPNNANVFNLLGLLYERKKEWEAAITNFQKACKMAEENNDKRLKNFRKNLERVKKTLTN